MRRLKAVTLTPVDPKEICVFTVLGKEVRYRCSDCKTAYGACGCRECSYVMCRGCAHWIDNHPYCGPRGCENRVEVKNIMGMIQARNRLARSLYP